MRWHAEHRQLDGLTLTCRSGGGGYHLYFRRPENVDLVGVVTKGVDLLKGKGQSVLAPPCDSPDDRMRLRMDSLVAPVTAAHAAVVDWSLPSALGRSSAPRRASRRQPRNAARKGLPIRARVEGAVSGSGGHRHTLLLAMKLAGTFPGSASGTCGKYSTAWNQTCLPPWNQRELQHKLQDALRHTRGWVAA